MNLTNGLQQAPTRLDSKSSIESESPLSKSAKGANPEIDSEAFANSLKQAKEREEQAADAGLGMHAEIGKLVAQNAVLPPEAQAPAVSDRPLSDSTSKKVSLDSTTKEQELLKHTPLLDGVNDKMNAPLKPEGAMKQTQDENVSHLRPHEKGAAPLKTNREQTSLKVAPQGLPNVQGQAPGASGKAIAEQATKATLPSKPQTTSAKLNLKNLNPDSLTGGLILPADAKVEMIQTSDFSQLSNNEGNSEYSFSDDEQTQVKSRPTNLSTEDFLSFRSNLKEGKKLVKEEIDSNVGRAQTESSQVLAPLVNIHELGNKNHTIQAHVTQGSQGKAILSHDAIAQMTGQVQGLFQAKQDGEIKIRLKPDHLGELMMSVKTNGQNVSLSIKAEHGQAKRIIEESLGALRDSLNQQNLNLAQVEVLNPPSASQAMPSGLDSQFSAQMDLNQGGRQGFDQSDRKSSEERVFQDSAQRNNLNKAVVSRYQRTGGQVGLDMIA